MRSLAMADGPKTKLAEERTDFAEDRTVLANERTFAGWLRTGFAAVGIALGFQALFGKVGVPWVPKAIATGFLGIALIVFLSAERRAAAVLRRLSAHQVETVGTGNMRLVTIASATATVALGAAIWLLDIAPS